MDPFGQPAPGDGGSTGATSPGRDLQGLRLLVDPGHGGFDGGCVDGEAGWTLDVAMDLVRRCRAMGALALAARTEDTFVPRIMRSAAAAEWAPDIVLSIHRAAPLGQAAAAIRLGAPWWRRRARILGRHLLAALNATVPLRPLPWGGPRQGRCVCPAAPWRTARLLVVAHPAGSGDIGSTMAPQRWAEGLARGIAAFWAATGPAVAGAGRLPPAAPAAVPAVPAVRVLPPPAPAEALATAVASAPPTSPPPAPPPPAPAAATAAPATVPGAAMPPAPQAPGMRTPAAERPSGPQVMQLIPGKRQRFALPAASQGGAPGSGRH